MPIKVRFDEISNLVGTQFGGVSECITKQKIVVPEKTKPLSRKQKRELAEAKRVEKEQILAATKLYIGDIDCRVDGTLDIAGAFSIAVATDDCCQRCGCESKVYSKMAHFTKICRRCANILVQEEKSV